MHFPFTYKKFSGEFVYIPFLDKGKLFVNGKEIAGSKGIWKLSDGTIISQKIFGLMFPTLMVNDKEEIRIINLKKWEWFFVLLPGIIFFLFGLIPGFVSFAGIYINLAIFVSSRINRVLKILLSLLVLILGIAVVLVFSSILRRN